MLVALMAVFIDGNVVYAAVQDVQFLVAARVVTAVAFACRVDRARRTHWPVPHRRRHPLTDEHGVSHITNPDHASGLVDQIENPAAIRKRITITYWPPDIRTTGMASAPPVSGP
jgi:hypothetical protein